MWLFLLLILKLDVDSLFMNNYRSSIFRINILSVMKHYIGKKKMFLFDWNSAILIGVCMGRTNKLVNRVHYIQKHHPNPNGKTSLNFGGLQVTVFADSTCNVGTRITQVIYKIEIYKLGDFFYVSHLFIKRWKLGYPERCQNHYFYFWLFFHFQKYYCFYF